MLKIKLNLDEGRLIVERLGWDRDVEVILW